MLKNMQEEENAWNYTKRFFDLVNKLNKMGIDANNEQASWIFNEQYRHAKNYQNQNHYTFD